MYGACYNTEMTLLHDKYSSPTPATHACISRLQVASPTDQQWKINPFQTLPPLYLAFLSHPLIVCGLPSAAWETANAQ